MILNIYSLKKYFVSDYSLFYILLLLFFILIMKHPENNNAKNISAKKGKYVTTMIDTKWNLVPLVLEMSEFMAEESQHTLWSFVDSISEFNPALSNLGM